MCPTVLAGCAATLIAAAPAASADHVRRTKDGGRIVSLQALGSGSTFIDHGAPGVSAGDVRTFSGPLFDPSGRRRVGEQELSCLVTDAADEASGAHAAICTRVARLNGLGELVAIGAVTYQDVATPN